MLHLTLIHRATVQSFQKAICLVILLSFVQTVQLVLDRCEGVEPVDGASQEGEEPGCRATGETPGQQRYGRQEESTLSSASWLFSLPLSLAPPTFRYLDVSQPLQLGGVKGGSLQRHHQGYSGCIRNLQLDSQVMCMGIFCHPLGVTSGLTAKALFDSWLV